MQVCVASLCKLMIECTDTPSTLRSCACDVVSTHIFGLLRIVQLIIYVAIYIDRIVYWLEKAVLSCWLLIYCDAWNCSKLC